MQWHWFKYLNTPRQCRDSTRWTRPCDCKVVNLVLYNIVFQICNLAKNKVLKTINHTGINLWLEFIDDKSLNLENCWKITQSQIAYFSFHLKKCLFRTFFSHHPHCSPRHDRCAHSPPRMSSWPWTCWAPPGCSCQSLASPGLSCHEHSCRPGPGWDRNAPQQLVHLGAKLSEPLNKFIKFW